MRTHFGVASGSVTRANINLDPVSPPQELREDIVASELRDGFELLHGYTGDAVTHRPVPGVHLRLKESGASATSDVRGYFQLYVVAVSTADASGPEDFPATDTLTATASGYKTYTLSGLLHVPGSDSVIRIALTPGIGSSSQHIDHKPFMPPSSVPDLPPPTGYPTTKSLHNWLAGSGQAMVPQSAEWLGAGLVPPWGTRSLPAHQSAYLPKRDC